MQLQRSCLLVAVGVAALAAASLAQDCSNGDILDDNPIGTCACDEHLWIGPECKEGYFCFERSGRGCHMVCPDGEIIMPIFSNGTWLCLPEGVVLPTPPAGSGSKEGVEPRRGNVCPHPNGYNICTGDEFTPAPTPQEPVNGNPLGTCRCDGEIWVSEGCSYGFYCNSSLANGGEYKKCPYDESLYVDFAEGTWTCTSDTDTCPGAAILGHGCPMRECTYSLNPLGNCECDGQFFINDDCTTGFFCDSNIPDPYIYDGCIQYCFPDQILKPSFNNETWECIPRVNQARPCPGEFNLNCPNEAYKGNFTSDLCECEGHLIVNDDCSEAFYCLSRLANGGRSTVCPPGQVIIIDYDTMGFGCVPDEGQCPGLGGFQLGCADGALPIPDLPCDWAPDPFTDGCDGCEGQIIMDHDCSRAFYCSQYVGGAHEGNDGCLKSCEDHERVKLDILEKTWECVNRTDSFVCPGYVKVDCNDNFDVKCGCEHEVWLNGDCTQGFLCKGPQDPTTGENPGELLGCLPGSYLIIDFETRGYRCTRDAAECPGSYHFGCDGGDIEELPCIYDNPYGECQCDGQLFINEDCNSGFYCTSDIDDPLIFDGCFKNCTDDNILVPRFSEDRWECVPPPSAGFLCPGKFSFNCPGGDLPTSNFNSSMCECNGQFWMSDDCRESFFCLSYRPGGGIKGSCPDGEIIQFDFEDFGYSCVPDEGQCPGLGFSVGCGDGAPPPPSIECEWAKNPIDTCQCEGQIWMGEDCTSAFYCSVYVEGDDNEGCLVECTNGQKVTLDLTTMTWDCVDESPDYVCPGQLHLDCTPNSDIHCECDNQYWVYEDCTKGFKCTGPETSGGINPGNSLTCPPGHFIELDLQTGSYDCTTNGANCPLAGSYHFGCHGGDITHQPTGPTTTTTTTTTTTPDGQTSTTSTTTTSTTTTSSSTTTTTSTTTTKSTTTTSTTTTTTTTTEKSTDTTTEDTTTKPSQPDTTTSSAVTMAAGLISSLCSMLVAAIIA